jgi:hypothetical protein
MKASDINMTNTPMLLSNATLAIIKSQLSPIGALLLSSLTSLGIFGALAFSKNGLSYGDKLLMNNFGSNFLWSSLDYVRPDTKQEVIEGAMDLGSAVSAQRWDLVPHVLLGDTLSAMLGESTTSAASPLSAARNLQRAAQGVSSGSLAGGRGNTNSNTIKSAAIDPRQQMADLRNYQKEAGLMSAPDNPQAVRPVNTGAAGANPGARPRIGGTGVNSMPMYDDSVMIPSDEEEQFESAFGMHVADGTGGASTRDDIEMERNTLRDIYAQDTYYYPEEDVY